jgi:hypothetical protein
MRPEGGFEFMLDSLPVRGNQNELIGGADVGEAQKQEPNRHKRDQAKKRLRLPGVTASIH